MATKIRIDPSTSGYPTAKDFAEERGLQHLGSKKLAPMADKDGVVGLEELERLARVARIDTDRKLTPEERERIDAYLKDRGSPIIGVPNSSLVDARSTTRKPVDGYLTVASEVVGKDLVLTFDITAYKGAVVDGEYAKRILLKGVRPNEREDCAAIRMQRYGSKGENASVGTERAGSGAGYIVGIADKDRGALLVNLSAAGAIAGDAPDLRTLFTPAELAKNPQVKALAKKQGLDPKKLEVEVLQVSLHSDFLDGSRGHGAPHTTLHTLWLALELREEGSRKKPRQVDMTTYVEGNVTKPLRKLKLDDLEPGMRAHAGYIYPPSFAIEPREAPGGSPTHHAPNPGGGGEASTVVYRGGGGE